MLICPVCRRDLSIKERRALCACNHSFDLAKEGYVNLLRSSKSGDLIGDDKLAARSRRDFLNKGYYEPLKAALAAIFADKSGSVLDICCGEGYYTHALGQNGNLSVIGFDISKEMIRLAAKRGGATYFVANMASIPIEDQSIDYCVHLFAPFNEKEFCRVMKPGGRLYTVIPGAQHLFGLKQAVYDEPYRNDEKLPDTQQLRLLSVQRIATDITLTSRDDIAAIFRMTPYYFHTSPADRMKLDQYDTLLTPVEFLIAEYEKTI